MTPEALLLNTLDDLEAKMQILRNAFSNAAAQGRAAGEVTDWIRSMERPLFNSRAYLNEEAVPEGDAAERAVEEPAIREEAVEEEPKVIVEPAGGGLFE
jgi:3'-5' exoribonuclease